MTQSTTEPKDHAFGTENDTTHQKNAAFYQQPTLIQAQIQL